MWGTQRRQEHTCERLRLLCGDRAEVLEIALVADEHDDDVRVGVVAELLQPPCHVHVRRVLRDVVHEQRADSPTVVPMAEGNG